MLKRLALVSVMGLLPLCSYAQNPFAQNPFDDGSSAATAPAWSSFKLPKKTVSLNFKNASQGSVLAFFSKASGITMVPNTALTTGLSLFSPKALSMSEAFNLLNVTLQQLGYQLQKQGTLLVVTAKPQGGGIDFRSLMGTMGTGGDQNRSVIQTYPIQFASASAVAKTINDVFSTDTSSAANNNPFAAFAGRGRGGFQQQLQIGGTPGAAAGGRQGPQVHASSDDYSNNVIVNAPQSIQDQIADLLKKIDKSAQEPYKSVVYQLKYASSDDLAPIVQNVLTANAPTGKGATGQTADFGSRIAQAARFGSTQASFGTVVSEPRTNQLVVTGTPENQKLVADVVTSLDKPIKFDNSAVVIPLSNARADNVAYVINQAFQSKVANTTSSQLSNYGNTGNTGNQNISRFQNTGSSAGKLGSPTGLNLTPDPTQGSALNTPTTANAASAIQASTAASGAAPPPGADPAELAAEQVMVQQALGDPNIDPLALQTNIAVQGGFLNQLNRGNGGASSAQQNAPMQVRDANGNMVNVHNLTGNVTLIPDINSNSVIVVTNPENMDIVKSILDQLDRVPPQVMIQTIIVEATLDKNDKFGVEWSYLGGKFGTIGANFGLQSGLTSTANTTPPGLTDTITNGKLTAFIQAIAQDTKFRVLETPRIFAANNQQAEINVSQSVPYIISSQIDVNGNFNNTFGFENVGVVLDVQPQITANGMVNLAVVQTANELQGFTSFNAPIVNQRIANTDVSVRDGETIVLGGIMGDTKTSTVNKIPLLGDIPIIGNLFRSTVKGDTRTELLIFMTPHIVLSPDDAAKLRQKTENELLPGTRKDVDDTIKQEKVVPSTPTTGGH